MKIFISRRIPHSAIELLEAEFGADAVNVYPSDDAIPRSTLLESVRGIDALLPILTEKIDAELLDAAGPQLQIVANMAVGYDNVDVPACTARKVPVTNTPGVLTETTADLAWALLLGAARRVGEGEHCLRNGEWKCWGPLMLLGIDVFGKTLGIFGMGRIGQAVARRARGFNMPVIYHNRTRLPESLEAELGARHVDKATLLAESDFLSIHAPLTDETRHAFSDREFIQMKTGAVLINTARGPLVHEEALARALKSNKLFAAGIDVFEREPQVHPDLLERPNALLLPHLGSATQETRGKMADMAARNIIARLRGERPPNCINPEALD